MIRLRFFFNLIVFFYLELMFFLTFVNHIIFESLLIQPIICLPLFCSILKTFKSKRKYKRAVVSFYFLWLVSITPLLCAENTIVIHSNTQPKYTFWCGRDFIPTDNETLTLFHELIIPNGYPCDNETLERFRKLIEYNIGFYVCIGGDDFAHLKNSDSFIKSYEYLRTLDIFNETKGFYIDAEPPHLFAMEVINAEWYKKIPLIIENYPTIEEIKNATSGYKTLIDLVHADNKTIGIVKDLQWGVYIDTGLGNIYYLKQLNWDSEMYMYYRISIGGGLRRFTDFEMFDFIRYYKEDVLLGSFGCGYAWEDLLTDITISSYFNHERIYLYHWQSFITKFNLSYLKSLKPYEKYQITYPLIEALNQFIYYHAIDWGNVIIGSLN